MLLMLLAKNNPKNNHLFVKYANLSAFNNALTLFARNAFTVKKIMNEMKKANP